MGIASTLVLSLVFGSIFVSHINWIEHRLRSDPALVGQGAESFDHPVQGTVQGTVMGDGHQVRASPKVQSTGYYFVKQIQELENPIIRLIRYCWPQGSYNFE
jgi:hypothetical protein